MIKKLAWNTFKNTGDINTYLEFVETENIEKQIEKNIVVANESASQEKDKNIKIDGEKWVQ